MSSEGAWNSIHVFLETLCCHAISNRINITIRCQWRIYANRLRAHLDKWKTGPCVTVHQQQHHIQYDMSTVMFYTIQPRLWSHHKHKSSRLWKKEVDGGEGGGILSNVFPIFITTQCDSTLNMANHPIANEDPFKNMIGTENDLNHIM